MKVYAYGTEINTETDRTIYTIQTTDPEQLYQEWIQLKATPGNTIYIYTSSNYHNGYTGTGEERDPAAKIIFPDSTHYNDIFDALFDLDAEEEEIKKAIPDDLKKYHTLDIADPIGIDSDGQFLFDPQDAELTAEEFNRLADSYDLTGWLELDQRCGNYTRRAQYHSLKAAGYNVDAIDGYFDDDDKTTDDDEQN